MSEFPMGTIPYDFTFAQLMPHRTEPWEKFDEDHPWTIFYKTYWATKWGSCFKVVGETDDDVEDDMEEEDDATVIEEDDVVIEEDTADRLAVLGDGDAHVIAQPEFRWKGDDLVTSDNPEDSVEAQVHIPGQPDDFRFLIRAEYIRLYDALLEHYRNCAEQDELAGAVITGQPGIGMSVAHCYFAMRLLGEKIPILWQTGPELYLFASDGVYVERSNANLYPSTYLPALIDANWEQDVPHRLILYNANTYPILSTSPDERIWNRWEKNWRTPKVFIMNPWKRGEMLRALPLHFAQELSPAQIKKAKDTFERYGPVMGTVLQILEGEQKLNNQVSSAIQRMKDPSQILRILTRVYFLEADPDSLVYRICLIHRPVSNIAARHSVQIITPSIEYRLRVAIRSLDFQANVALHRSLTSEYRLGMFVQNIFPYR